jgi:hypothetical protein
MIELENKEYAPVLSRSHSPELKAPFDLPPVNFGVGDFICVLTASHNMVVDERTFLNLLSCSRAPLPPFPLLT